MHVKALCIVVVLSIVLSSVSAGVPAYGNYGYDLTIHHPSHYGYGHGGKSVRYDHRYVSPSIGYGLHGGLGGGYGGLVGGLGLVGGYGGHGGYH